MKRKSLRIFWVTILAAAALLGACGSGGGSPYGGNLVYTVTYDPSDATGGSVPLDTANYAEGDIVTVLGNTGSLVKTGAVFNGWYTPAGTGAYYKPGQTFVMGSSDATLYAVWAAF